MTAPVMLQVRRRPLLFAALGYAAIVLALFAEFIFVHDMQIPSHADGDTARSFLYQRLFGYAELRAGNLPLWNPHTFSGGPFVGVFQSAIFYPLNLVYLVLPIRDALLFEFVAHVYLMALLIYVWLRGRSVGPLPAFVAGAVVVLGSTTSLRVLAGQLSVLDTVCWWPLLLMSIDRLRERASLGWTLAGIFAATSMILAGHPPTALMAGFVTALYCVPYGVRGAGRLGLIARLVPVVVLPLLLAAVQLGNGLFTATEAVRGSGMNYAFSTSYSFPPEHMLTLLVPTFFGDASQFYLSYFGRVFFWDATLFLGIGGLLLALHGGANGRGPLRNLAVGCAVGLTLIAMGGYTPLYRVVYHLVPGFSYIRAPSKFLLFASVFAAVLAALGVQALLDRSGDPAVRARANRRTGSIALVLCALAAVIWAWVQGLPVGDASSPLQLIDTLRGEGNFVVEGDFALWREILSGGLALAVATSGGFGSLFFLAEKRRGCGALIVALALIELLMFARIHRGATPLTIDRDRRQTVVEAYRRAGGDRVLETALPSNVAMARRDHALWGYDPVILERYVRFMGMTQDVDTRLMLYPTLLRPGEYHPLHAMLRGRFEVRWTTHEIIEHPGAHPRFMLLTDYEVVEGPDASLAAVAAPGFDPRSMVILESPPTPIPEPGPGRAGRVQVLDQSTDHIDIEARLGRAALLVIGDAYSRGWRAVALDGSEQDSYTVLPANHVLRAVPLGPGHHRLRIEYSPTAHRAGVVISSVSIAVYLAAVAWWCVGALRRRSVARASTLPG